MEFRRFWEIIVRRRWIVIQSLIALPVFVFLLMILVKPVYQSEAKLWIKFSTLGQKFISNIPPEYGRFEFIDTANAMVTVEEVLKSDNVVRKVINDLGLSDKDNKPYRKKDFINPSMLKLIQKKIGVKIELVSDSESFKIIGYSSDPEQAKKIAEEVINNFTNEISVMYREEVLRAIDIIKKRMVEARIDLEKSEKEVSGFRSEKQLYNVEEQRSELLSDISTLELELYSTERSIKATRSALKTIKTEMDKQPVFRETQNTVERNPVISSYKKNLTRQELSLARLRLELTPEHPQVKDILKQIEELKEKISGEIEKIFSSQRVERNAFYDDLVSRFSNSEINLTVYSANKEVLENQISEKKSQLDTLSRQQDELTRLTLEMTNTRSQYYSLDSNLENAKSAVDMKISNAMVIQRPILFKNVKENFKFPPEKKLPFLVLALIAGTLLGLFMVFVIDYIDESVWDSREAEAICGSKVLGSFPKFEVLIYDASMVQNPYLMDIAHNFVANIMLFKEDKDTRVFTFISPADGNGKSVMSLLAAAGFARTGKRTVLVDCNFRDPSINNLFGFGTRKGAIDYLSGRTDFSEIVNQSAEPNLDIIAAGSPNPDNPQKVISSDRFPELVSVLTGNYDAVVIDTPSHSRGSDALLISKNSQHVIVVVEQGKTLGTALKELATSLQMAGIKTAGIVFNKVRPKYRV